MRSFVGGGGVETASVRSFSCGEEAPPLQFDVMARWLRHMQAGSDTRDCVDTHSACSRERALTALDHFYVIGWIEPHTTVLASFAPALFVFVFQLLEHVALFKRKLVGFGALVIVERANRYAGLTVVHERVVRVVIPVFFVVVKGIVGFAVAGADGRVSLHGRFVYGLTDLIVIIMIRHCVVHMIHIVSMIGGQRYRVVIY